ncbi:MAG: hypothetical protein ABIK28_05300 [Planctomycetota bacterium]
MKAKLIIILLCSLFFLALVTVRLKTRELLLRYEIADLETFEVLLYERYTFSKSEVEKKAGMIDLLTRAAELDIDLRLKSPDGRDVPLIASTEDGFQLE